ncbi:hypothetical protein K470DRAFT_259422 [Piedraia hortae CBS 480.64]|uniref:Uncharacterized protein n=1 Tax=Piedraia hortae CBS 480.64 TaxID=1314780 RepID=A0A6A7BUJ3_9PEZI|nr:hypothetical protein K470DRAFT_259422 [Piedraia hortae CBS 480.64]
MAPLPAHVYRMHEHSSSLEIAYLQSVHSEEMLSKDEENRKLRFNIATLEDDNHEIREQLQQEEDRADAFERLVNENLARAETAEADARELETELRARKQELAMATSEIETLKTNTEDVTAAVTEKLALARELSMLRPEIEHLKGQAQMAESLMTEKLALQRQLSEAKCEVENAKREAQRALAKRRNTGVEIAQEAQMDELRRQLEKEKRARQRAEEANASDLEQERKARLDAEKEVQRLQAEMSEQKQMQPHVDNETKDLRQSLKKSEKARQKLEAEIEALKQQLAQEKSSRQTSAPIDNEASNLRTELASAKESLTATQSDLHTLQQTLSQSQKTNLRLEKSIESLESQKTLLEEKLNQFRTKLRSTKEKLKAAEQQNKKAATSTETEATVLGTPGLQRKKRHAQAGEKSTFSLTPFLHKTVNTVIEEDDQDVMKPLAQRDGNRPAKTLEKVGEEGEQNKGPVKTNPVKKVPAKEGSENNPEQDHQGNNQGDGQGDEKENEQANAIPATKKVPTKVDDGGKKIKKPRKSIHDIPSFDAEKKVVVKKQKKLKGGLGRTLFDLDDEHDLGARRKLTATNAVGGCGFSPLKRQRRGLDDTLRG